MAKLNDKASIVVPILVKNEQVHIVMVGQYRIIGTDDSPFVLPDEGLMTYELPGGKCEEDEIPLDCASRELEEETGFWAHNLCFLCITSLFPLSKLKIHIYMMKPHLISIQFRVTRQKKGGES